MSSIQSATAAASSATAATSNATINDSSGDYHTDSKYLALAGPRIDPSTSWSKNLLRKGKPGFGFWGDARWYDLQISRQMPFYPQMLEELMMAIPAMPSGSAVLDLCCGTGMNAEKLLSVYPHLAVTLLDNDATRLSIATHRIRRLPQQPDTPPRTLQHTVDLSNPDKLIDGKKQYSLVVASLALHVIVGHDEAGQSATQRYLQLFKLLHRNLQPGGHLIFADHVALLPLYQQLKLMEAAGFVDVDVSWRQQEYFVAGGRAGVQPSSGAAVRSLSSAVGADPVDEHSSALASLRDAGSPADFVQRASVVMQSYTPNDTADDGDERKHQTDYARRPADTTSFYATQSGSDSATLTSYGRHAVHQIFTQLDTEKAGTLTYVQLHDFHPDVEGDEDVWWLFQSNSQVTEGAGLTVDDVVSIYEMKYRKGWSIEQDLQRLSIRL